MRYRVLNGGCSVAAATGLVAASLVAGVASASVEVRGSIEGLPDGASAEVSLVSAPPLYDLLAAVLADDPSGLYPVQATVQAQDGRFAFEVAELGVRWVRVRRGGSASEALLLVGPETDMLLPPIEAARTASCTLKLVTPGSAWVVAGRSLRDLRFSRSWNTWPPLRRLEEGKASRYEFEAERRMRSESGVTRSYERLVVGAPGYEPAPVECVSGAVVAVELERTLAASVEGVLRRSGSPLAAAVLVRANGWPAGTTDELGRYRAPEGAYRVLSGDGSIHAVELTGGVAELAVLAPQPVAVEMKGIEPSRGELPFVLAAHWSSSGALLARYGGRPERGRFLVGAGPGVARTTVLSRGFAPLIVTWSSPPAGLVLEPLRRLEGVAVDFAGAPVGGAEVSVSRSVDSPVGVTDGAGRFLVEVAERESAKWLVARASGYRQTRIELSEGLSQFASEQIVFQMATAPAIVGRLVSARSGGGVRGTVGLADTLARESLVGDVSLWNLQDPMLLQVVSTDDDGAFRLDPVDQGRLRLVAAAAGHGTVWRKLPDADPGAAGDQHLGDLVLGPEIVLRGQVFDEDGSPIAGANVDFGRRPSPIFRGPLSMNSEAIREVAADENGQFRIAGLALGDEVALEVQAPGFVKASVPFVRVDASLEVEEVDVRLRKAMELSGRVTDELTGQGIEEVRIGFDQTIRGGYTSTRSADKGDFVLGGFPAGAGILVATAGGYERLERSLAEVPRTPLELVLRPQPELDVLGAVTREGAPVAGASVSIGSAVSVTDVSGRFALKSSPGRVRLQCRVPGAARSIGRELEVSATLGEITIDVTPVILRGRVAGPDGSAVPSASVEVWGHSGHLFLDRRHAGTGPGGEFEVQLEPGRYTVMASKDSARSPEVQVMVAAGDEPHVELTVPEPRLLRVRVVGLSPAEAGEVVVSVRAIFAHGGMMSTGLPHATGGTDLEPVFETHVREWNDATVVATASVAGRSRRAPIRLAPGGVTEVEISFADRRGQVLGTVTLDGWPLAGERVYVTDERQGLTWDVRTDHRGAFVIGDLNVGDEIAVAAVGERRTVRVTEVVPPVDLEARTAAVRGRLLDAETWAAGGRHAHRRGAVAECGPDRGGGHRQTTDVHTVRRGRLPSCSTVCSRCATDWRCGLPARMCRPKASPVPPMSTWPAATWT